MFSFETNWEASAAVFSCPSGTFPDFIAIKCVVMLRKKGRMKKLPSKTEGTPLAPSVLTEGEGQQKQGSKS